jgi:hypothetical protein
VIRETQLNKASHLNSSNRVVSRKQQVSKTRESIRLRRNIPNVKATNAFEKQTSCRCDRVIYKVSKVAQFVGGGISKINVGNQEGRKLCLPNVRTKACGGHRVLAGECPQEWSLRKVAGI